MNCAIDILSEFNDQIVIEKNREKRARAERSSEYFCAHFTHWPRTGFHQKWAEWLEAKKRGVLLAPREHAKSQQITINQIAWRVLKNPDLRVLIVMDTEFMAARMGRAIKNLLTSRAIKETWGDVKGKKWADTEFTLAGSSLSEKEATITCLGVGGSVTSGHYDIAVLDDIVDFENSRTQLQRDKLWEWFRMTLYPVIARAECKLWIIGTRYHYDDFYGRLQDKEFSKRPMPLLREQALSPDGKTALWPAQYPLSVLLRIRADLDLISWSAQYQNDADAMKGAYFKADWIRRYKKLPDGLRLYQGADLAISESDAADYFAEVTIGQAPDTGNIYIIGEYRGRLSFDQQFKKIVENFEYYDKSSRPVMKIGIESNQYQAALARKLKATTRLPIKEIHHHKDKVTRALRVQPHFENGKVFFPCEGTEILEHELLVFEPDNKDKKDVMDAMMNCFEIAGMGSRRMARRRAKPAGM